MVGVPESLHLREGPGFISLVFHVLQPDEAADDPGCYRDEETDRPSISLQPRHQACRPHNRRQSCRHSGFRWGHRSQKLMIPYNESMFHFLQNRYHSSGIRNSFPLSRRTEAWEYLVLADKISGQIVLTFFVFALVGGLAFSSILPCCRFLSASCS